MNGRCHGEKECAFCGLPFQWPGELRACKVNLRKSDKCRYLGEAITREGVTVTVKCDCGGSTVFYPSFKCEIYGRCLPSLEPTEKWHDRPESKLYQACHGCPDKLPINQGE